MPRLLAYLVVLVVPVVPSFACSSPEVEVSASRQASESELVDPETVLSQPTDPFVPEDVGPESGARTPLTPVDPPAWYLARRNAFEDELERRQPEWAAEGISKEERKMRRRELKHEFLRPRAADFIPTGKGGGK